MLLLFIRIHQENGERERTNYVKQLGKQTQFWPIPINNSGTSRTTAFNHHFGFQLRTLKSKSPAAGHTKAMGIPSCPSPASCPSFSSRHLRLAPRRDNFARWAPPDNAIVAGRVLRTACSRGQRAGCESFPSTTSYGSLGTGCCNSHAGSHIFFEHTKHMLTMSEMFPGHLCPKQSNRMVLVDVALASMDHRGRHPWLSGSLATSESHKAWGCSSTDGGASPPFGVGVEWSFGGGRAYPRIPHQPSMEFLVETAGEFSNLLPVWKWKTTHWMSWMPSGVPHAASTNLPHATQRSRPVTGCSLRFLRSERIFFDRSISPRRFRPPANAWSDVPGAWCLKRTRYKRQRSVGRLGREHNTQTFLQHLQL